MASASASAGMVLVEVLELQEQRARQQLTQDDTRCWATLMDAYQTVRRFAASVEDDSDVIEEEQQQQQQVAVPHTVTSKFPQATITTTTAHGYTHPYAPTTSSAAHTPSPGFRSLTLLRTNPRSDSLGEEHRYPKADVFSPHDRTLLTKLTKPGLPPPAMLPAIVAATTPSSSSSIEGTVVVPSNAPPPLRVLTVRSPPHPNKPGKRRAGHPRTIVELLYPTPAVNCSSPTTTVAAEVVAVASCSFRAQLPVVVDARARCLACHAPCGGLHKEGCEVGWGRGLDGLDSSPAGGAHQQQNGRYCSMRCLTEAWKQQQQKSDSIGVIDM